MEARELLLRQQREMQALLNGSEPEPEPEPFTPPLVEDMRTFLDLEAVAILSRFYAQVDPPKADPEHLKRTTDAMINMNPENWQLKFFRMQKKRYKTDPRDYTTEALAARVVEQARARGHDPLAGGPWPTPPPVALPAPQPGASLSVYLACPDDLTKTMKIAVLPLHDTEVLAAIRVAILGAENPDSIIPREFVFLADGDKVTAKQERKLSGATVRTKSSVFSAEPVVLVYFRLKLV